MNRKQLRIDQSENVGLPRDYRVDKQLKTPSAPRCKVGDLAIVCGNAFDENLGCIVEVLRPMAPIPGWEDIFIWEIRATGQKLKTKTAITADIGFHKVCGSPDRCLIPIVGLPLDESAEESDVRIAQAEMLGLRVS